MGKLRCPRVLIFSKGMLKRVNRKKEGSDFEPSFLTSENVL
ncbi:hypothetical protein JMA_04330 [Jeotgalibacillus malaysiensis]|uniref:Uncharacterized protein n=1 Tax=Jeotgalibacillus malaysiensis TaxID=1508404 RepID=A0A0B5AH76_9BACL|nr:hypothetical protein JMA_04330 [Jeotgalibacillus malaysiensis]